MTPEEILKWQEQFVHLHKVRDELKEVLRREKLCGVVLLSDPKNMDYALEMEAPWTCMRFEKDPGDPEGRSFLRFKTTNLPPAEKKQKLEDSVGTILGFIDALEHIREQCLGVANHLATLIPEMEHRSRFIPPGL